MMWTLSEGKSARTDAGIPHFKCTTFLGIRLIFYEKIISGIEKMMKMHMWAILSRASNRPFRAIWRLFPCRPREAFCYPFLVWAFAWLGFLRQDPLPASQKDSGGASRLTMCHPVMSWDCDISISPVCGTWIRDFRSFRLDGSNHSFPSFLQGLTRGKHWFM